MLVERLVYFEGMVYKIEEEIYSETDHSSVYTSEDSFEEADYLQKKFSKASPLLSVQDGQSDNLNATMTSIGFTIAGKKNLDKIEGYPAPDTPDGTKSRSDITAKQIDVSDDALESKSDNNPDSKSDISAENKGDETPKSKKSDGKSKGKKSKEKEGE